MIERNKGDFCIDLEEKFTNNQGLVYYFAKRHRVDFMSYEDYIQQLLTKFWELIQKFNWNKYNNDFDTNRAFCGYIKRGLKNEFYNLIKQNNKENAIYSSLSLDSTYNEEDNLFFIDLIADDYDEESFREKQYYIMILRQLVDKDKINGFLIDYIDGLNYTQISEKHKCSRGKVRRGIEKELNELRRVV